MPNTRRMNFERPSWSKPRLNSGWKRITSTTSPMLISWLSSHDTALKRRMLESPAITSTTAMPLNSEFERVWITSLIM